MCECVCTGRCVGMCVSVSVCREVVGVCVCVGRLCVCVGGGGGVRTQEHITGFFCIQALPVIPTFVVQNLKHLFIKRGQVNLSHCLKRFR